MKQGTPTHNVRDMNLPMAQTFAITGASGFIGSALVSELRQSGAKIIRLVRDADSAGADSVYWNPDDASCDLSGLNGVNAVVHLAGESIVGFWTKRKRQQIYDSRVRATANLVGSLLRLEQPPQTFISASAVGFYGSRGADELNENSEHGAGFLAETCQQWEAASAPLQKAGVRVVHMRIGVVLDPAGGALQKAVSAFRLGLGGRFGSGKQYMSWIMREDLVRALIFALRNDTLSGPVNAVSPNPITNAEYTAKLGKALHRPTLLTAPEFLLRLVPGGVAEEMFLASIRAVPERLLAAGFEFLHPDIDSALQALLAKR